MPTDVSEIGHYSARTYWALPQPDAVLTEAVAIVLALLPATSAFRPGCRSAAAARIQLACCSRRGSPRAPRRSGRASGRPQFTGPPGATPSARGERRRGGRHAMHGVNDKKKKKKKKKNRRATGTGASWSDSVARCCTHTMRAVQCCIIRRMRAAHAEKRRGAKGTRLPPMSLRRVGVGLRGTISMRGEHHPNKRVCLSTAALTF